MVNIDNILDDINGFGKYQKIRYFLILLAGILPPITIYIHSFIAANPPHRCTIPELFPNDIYQSTVNSSIYQINKCSYRINNTTYKCTQWVFDKTYYQSTLTEEWGMVCDRKVWRTHVQTVYFSGLLFGSFLIGLLSDKFGRRPIVLFSFLLIIVGGIGVTFGPQKSYGASASYVVYAFSRFLIAIGTRGINLSAYVLGIEILDAKRKTFGGMIFHISSPIGQLVLVTLAYFIRDWRQLAFFSCLPTVPFLLYYFILPESPRWLLMKKRNTDALKVFKDIAQVNKRELNTHLWNEFLSKNQVEITHDKETFTSILKSPANLLLLLVMFFHWIVSNFVFYGLGLKSNDFGVNPYATFFISAIVELLSRLCAVLVVDRFGRKWSYGSCIYLSGLACFLIIFFEHKIAIVALAMIGKFFASASHSIIYLYTSEIFPTSIRNSCVGACSMMARIGSIIAPSLNALGDYGWKNLPFMVFGISGIFAGLTTIILPETLGRTLPNTIKESEKIGIFSYLKKCNHIEC